MLCSTMVAIHSFVRVVVKIADVETCQILIKTNYTSNASTGNQNILEVSS